MIKLNEKLVLLQRGSAGSETVLNAQGVRITLKVQGAGQREADLVFEAGDDLRAGYRGYYKCHD